MNDKSTLTPAEARNLKRLIEVYMKSTRKKLPEGKRRASAPVPAKSPLPTPSRNRNKATIDIPPCPNSERGTVNFSMTSPAAASLPKLTLHTSDTVRFPHRTLLGVPLRFPSIADQHAHLIAALGGSKPPSGCRACPLARAFRALLGCTGAGLVSSFPKDIERSTPCQPA